MGASGRKVLIADDEPDMRAFIQAVLEDDGYEFLMAADGDEALAAVRKQHPDLIILDVQMPGKTGLEVFDELRHDEATRGIPVVVLTGIRERTGVGFSGREMGSRYGSKPEAYLEKPVDPDTLRDAVARLLRV